MLNFQSVDILKKLFCLFELWEVEEVAYFYVIWDAVRLDRTGAKEVLVRQWEKSWGTLIQGIVQNN